MPETRVSRFINRCAVMTLESFSCVFCLSKEFNRVTDWLKHSLQAIVVYIKYLFMFQNDYKRLGHSVICSIDYWLLYIKYVNRKFKWYENLNDLCAYSTFPLCIAHMHGKTWNVSWNKSITMFVSHTWNKTKVLKSRKSKWIF